MPTATATADRPRTMTEHDRLKALLVDPRDATAAVMLAQKALPFFDPLKHKLTRVPGDERRPGEMSYPQFFRQTCPAEFATTRNIAAAGHVLDILIEESKNRVA